MSLITINQLNKGVNKMRIVLKSNDEVCHYWANEVQAEGRSNNMSFHGDKIYSYSTCIAKRINGIIFISDKQYSNTTSKQLGLIRRACNYQNTVNIGYPNGSIYDNKNYAEQYIKDNLTKASTAKTRRDFYLSNAYNYAKNFNTFLGAFNAENKTEDSSYFDLSQFEKIDLTQLAIETKARIKKENAERKALELAYETERKARQALILSNWLNGESNQRPQGGKIYLRIQRDEIQTSWGANIPVKSAKVLWVKIQRVKESGVEYTPENAYNVGHYRLNKISILGNVTIGCHYIEYEQLQNIAKQLGLIE